MLESVLGHLEKPARLPLLAVFLVLWLPCSLLRCRVGSRVSPSKGWLISLPLPPLLPPAICPDALLFVLAGALTVGNRYNIRMCLACLLELKLFEFCYFNTASTVFLYWLYLPAASTYIQQMLKYSKPSYSRLPINQQAFSKFLQNVQCRSWAESTEIRQC